MVDIHSTGFCSYCLLYCIRPNADAAGDRNAHTGHSVFFVHASAHLYRLQKVEGRAKKIQAKGKASRKVRPTQGTPHEDHVRRVGRNQFGNLILWCSNHTKIWVLTTGNLDFVRYLFFRGLFINSRNFIFDRKSKGQKSPQCREWQTMD